MVKQYQKIVDELMPEAWSDDDGDFYDSDEIEEAIRRGIKRGIKLKQENKLK